MTQQLKSLTAMQETGSVSGLGRISGGGNGNTLWYSCLKNPMDSVTESDTTEPLNRQRYI